jgi:hypothetical protein
MSNAVTFLSNVADLCVGRKNINQCHLDTKMLKGEEIERQKGMKTKRNKRAK